MGVIGADPPPRMNPEAVDVRLPAVGVGSPGLKPPALFKRSLRSRWGGEIPRYATSPSPAQGAGIYPRGAGRISGRISSVWWGFGGLRRVDV